MNRRRWLAATDANVEMWLVWYSPFSEKNVTRSRWFFPELSDYFIHKLARARQLEARDGVPLKDFMDRSTLEAFGVTVDADGFEVVEEGALCG